MLEVVVVTRVDAKSRASGKLKVSRVSAEPKKKAAAKPKAPPEKKAAEKRERQSGRETPRPDLLGNQFWRLRSSHGVKPKFASSEDLWDACCEYFQWIEDNPLQEMQAFAYKGFVNKQPMPKMRAMTMTGLWIFLDICHKTWYKYKERPGFEEVIEKVENIIWTQKFTGAAAEMLNPHIISRELGIKDKSEREISGPGGKPLETVTRVELVPMGSDDDSAG